VAEAFQKDMLLALRPVAGANAAVSATVQRLAEAASRTDDPEKLRQAIVVAARELLEASSTINGALEQVAGAR
jgi:hypothetical protein